MTSNQWNILSWISAAITIIYAVLVITSPVAPFVIRIIVGAVTFALLVYHVYVQIKIRRMS